MRIVSHIVSIWIALFLVIITSAALSLLHVRLVYGTSTPAPDAERTMAGSMKMLRKSEPATAVHPGGGKEDALSESNAAAAMCELERKLINAGLVNIHDMDSTILVDLKYASTRNFMGADVYGGMKHAYMQRETALKLKKANEILKASHPHLRILVGDACRPRSVQRIMYGIVKGTAMQKYVANPAAVSMHNYGAAVDVTIADKEGNRLDMGCPMDHFGILSHPGEEIRLLREGKLTEQQVWARKLLRDVMTKAGFQVLSIEWWHFNACSRKAAAARYKIIE